MQIVHPLYPISILLLDKVAGSVRGAGSQAGNLCLGTFLENTKSWEIVLDLSRLLGK